MVKNILKLPRQSKKAIIIIIDCISLAIAFFIAKKLLAMEGLELASPSFLLPLKIVIFVVISFTMGFYNHIFRYTILESSKRLIKLFLIYYVLINIIEYLLHSPFKIYGNFATTTIFLFIYISIRYAIYWFISNQTSAIDRQINVAIYGADEDSYKVIGLIRQFGSVHILGIFEDDAKRFGSILHGVEIYPSNRMIEMLSNSNVDFLLVNDRKKTFINRHIEELVKLKVAIKNMPLAKEILNFGLNFKKLDDYKIEELLYRDEADLIDEDFYHELIRDKCILITGGGGSIGGELAKQISRFNPKTLIILDHSEFNLYTIKNALTNFDKKKLVAVLGAYQDANLINELMISYSPNLIFHAAAYKHVPLLENNVFECINNNFFGTIKFIECISNYDVTHFTYISSDKAVRPTNVMGASKRLCEKYIQCMSPKSRNIKFTIVRFGNVLNSSGSVVPLFKSQIKNGGPVTVTHPEITRYFMTLSEAVFLVVKATDISKSGEIALLDMGKPIKILDLAKKMIELSGFSPLIVTDKCENLSAGTAMHIPITFSGIRAGEKLYEELLIEEDSIPSVCSKIYIASENYKDDMELNSFISTLTTLVDQRNLGGTLSIIETFSTANFSAIKFIN
jgi:FlaA1/EpsC-like NDP-sugar epimerase